MGTKDQLIAKLVLKEKPAAGWGTSAASTPSNSYSTASRTSGITEASVKNKYLAMTLMELRRACTQKGLSQIGVKDDLIKKLVPTPSKSVLSVATSRSVTFFHFFLTFPSRFAHVFRAGGQGEATGWMGRNVLTGKILSLRSVASWLDHADITEYRYVPSPLKWSPSR